MQRTMRILMANYEFPPIGGGAGKANLCLLKQYAGRDKLVIDVLTSAPKPGFTIEKFTNNITIYKVGVHKKNLHFWRKVEVIEWLFKASRYYRKLLNENDYDLAHAFFAFPTAYLCLRSAPKLPYIISLRGSDVPGLHARLTLDYKLLGPLFKLIWKKATVLVACSEGLKNRALRFLPLVPIDVICNGVDVKRFYPRETMRQSDELKLITVGRLSVTKRVEMLIEAVDILLKQGLKIRLLIVGGGAIEQSLRQLVSEKNLAQFIEVAGRVESEKMPDLYRANDLFVSASMQEGMSNAMLEAMACGLPIITTRCEGVEELIADNGIVVEQASADSIAPAIKSLANDPVRHEKMCDASVKQAKQFTWSRVAEQYLDCYRSVINNRRRIDA